VGGDVVPARWEVRLAGPTDVAVPVESPHAVVSRWLDADHQASVKPYALCPPRVAAGVTILEIRLLDDALETTLRDAAPVGAAVRLGRHVFRVVTAPTPVEHKRWPEFTGWLGARAWPVRFVSPVTFRRGDRSSPWPAPQSVVRSLVDRWRALQPDTAPSVPRGGLNSLWVSDVEGHSEALLLDGRIVSGFIGSIRYVCDGPDSDATAVDELLRFATYAGIGSHTAFGFGLVRVEPRDRRDRRHCGTPTGPAIPTAPRAYR
jgi:CRISPR-associated endoribonuclease Cas6